ncbi:MAG: sulfur carrier protein ThiS [Chitinispirillales bacterium]|jgi:thiamine biosynthesis protein ThiS|nr:sulfur carrier protein ThiS [Chitinispirillales bacterium]
MIANGKKIDLERNLSLQEFLDGMGYGLSEVAVEKNGAVVPKNSFETVMICDDDTLEIVRFVGGG